MNILNVENVSISYENRELLHSVNLGISDTDKIGIIGVNGTGKSTILSIIAGTVEPDQGKVIKSNTLRISYLKQNPDFDETKTLIQNVVESISGKDSHWDVAGEAKAMLRKFKIDDPEVNPSILSGGQKKRAALVAALLTPADLMILDEPTNHLDHEMIEFLEDYLSQYKGAIILVTHDRYFLDQVTNVIVEIDKASLYKYETNYSGFLISKQKRLDDMKATERKQAALYKKDLAWILRGARARSTKQKAHIKRFEELRDRDKIIEDRDVTMQSISSRLGGKTIICENISKSFGTKKLFDNFSYTFGKLDRIGIIGPNGCGKSTMLKIIAQLENSDTGYVEIGQTVKLGYFSQENDELPQKGTVLEAVKDIAEIIETEDGTYTASKMCETFLFDSNMQYTPVAKISGGEKRRLSLLRILMSAPNVLILDEPTNDLDIQTLRVLEDYLDTFAGIVITVSHDRYFLDRVVNRIFAFRDGKIVQSEGNYEEYLLHYPIEDDFDTKTKSEKASDNKNGTQNNWKENKKKNKLSFNEQREYDTIEQEIAEIEDKISSVEAEIAQCVTDYAKLNELTNTKTELDDLLENKLERFLELQDLIDSFNN